MITEVGWDGSIRRSVLETVGLPDAGHWEYLIEQILAVPPRYQATPGSPVYVIHAGARAVLVGAQNLAGPLYELVSIIQQRGRPALAAKQLYPFGHPHVGNRETPASLSGYERQELGGAWGQCR